jgi:hypothetical protein
MSSRKLRSGLHKKSRIDLSFKEKWEKILSAVDKPSVPVSVLERMQVHLIDGTKIDIDVSELLAQAEAEEIEEYLNGKMRDIDHLIADVDYFVNIDMVAKTIQPETDRILARF